MEKRDFDFRPNPARAIYVIGEFDDALLSKTIPEINRLRFESSDPITVFINSPGGVIRSLDVLIGCLWGTAIEGHKCRIITVASGDAHSAAATLLSLGEYTIAYLHSGIHFHGARIAELEVTTESASKIAAQLARTNRRIALRLAESIIRKLVHRFSLVCAEFDKIRSAPGCNDLSDLDCFVTSIKKYIGQRAGEVVDDAFKKTQTALTLAGKILPSVQFHEDQSLLDQDSAVFKAVLDHELEQLNESDNRLTEDVCSQIVIDYLILRDFQFGRHQKSLRSMAQRYGLPFLTPEEYKEYVEKRNTSPEDANKWLSATVKPRLRPFWYFTIRLCQQLQEGENILSPQDAYWIGAVDEVFGTKLLGYRSMMESQQSSDELPAAT